MASEQMYSLGEVLDDLLIRFILHAPEEERETGTRLFFQMEEAHWYYLDFYREKCPSLPDLKFKEFVDKILARFPPLEHYRAQLDEHTKKFFEYKTSINCCGAIILNTDRSKVLLVKGWSNKAGWSFPRGKINRSESEINCAIREVFEETGFDISNLANTRDYVDYSFGEQKVKLFIVSGVSEDTKFIAQTRKEISAFEWHSIAELNTLLRKSAGKYWAVVPYIHKLNIWLSRNKKQQQEQPQPIVQKQKFSPKKRSAVRKMKKEEPMKQFTILKRPAQPISVAAA